MSNNEQLLDFMAKACSYAQEHCQDPDAWDTGIESRVQLLQCVSYQMACFLAQNTRLGSNGVEWEIVLKELIDPIANKDGMMVKSEDEWKAILLEIVNDLDGWK